MTLERGRTVLFVAGVILVVWDVSLALAFSLRAHSEDILLRTEDLHGVMRKANGTRNRELVQ